jgi:hypothetical protein
MKTIKKYWLAIVTVAFILTTFVYIGIQHRKLHKIQDVAQLQAVELSTLQDSVSVYKNKSGELTYKLTSVEIEKGNLKKSLELAGFDIRELRADNIKWRNLNNALKLELQAAGQVVTTVRDTFRIENTDTIYYSKVDNWTNGYLSLFNAKVETKKLFFDYRYKVGLDIFQEPKKNSTLVTVKLTDPNASVTTANSITVTHKKKIWERGWLWAAIGLTGGILIAK